MRITQVHDNFLALLCSTIANALDDQGLGVTVGYALHHIFDECSSQSVQGSVLLVIGRTGNGYHAVCDLDAQLLGKLSGESALRSLDGNQVLFALYFYAGRNTNRFFSYS